MQVLAIVDSPEHVCCRYRIRAFRSAFEHAGHRLHVHALPRRIWKRLRLLSAGPRQVDVVILQRKLLPGCLTALLRRSASMLVFDFDDAVFLRDSFASKGLCSPRRLGRFRSTMQACDAVVAGNYYLAHKALEQSDRASVTMIPTCVDPSRYPLARHDRPAGQAQLAWIGSASTLQGIEQAAVMLDDVAEACPQARLKLICDRALCLLRLPVDFVPWSEATEATELASADVGVSWIPDDDWSRGKCGLKVLQYYAAGLPVVANPVGVHKEMIRHGKTGFLVESPEQWQKAVRRLARDPNLRRKMGRAGRRLVEEEYSVRVGAERWLHLLRTMRHRLQRAS